MFNYPIEKYHFYTTPNKVIAVSSYAGKRVRGVATCAEGDTFDIEKGKQLAAARCAQKIAEKRYARAQRERRKAIEAFNKADEKVGKMSDYVYDAKLAMAQADNHVNELLARM